MGARPVPRGGGGGAGVDVLTGGSTWLAWGSVLVNGRGIRSPWSARRPQPPTLRTDRPNNLPDPAIARRPNRPPRRKSRPVPRAARPSREPRPLARSDAFFAAAAVFFAADLAALAAFAGEDARPLPRFGPVLAPPLPRPPLPLGSREPDLRPDVPELPCLARRLAAEFGLRVAVFAVDPADRAVFEGEVDAAFFRLVGDVGSPVFAALRPFDPPAAPDLRPASLRPTAPPERRPVDLPPRRPRPRPSPPLPPPDRAARLLLT